MWVTLDAGLEMVSMDLGGGSEARNGVGDWWDWEVALWGIQIACW